MFFFLNRVKHCHAEPLSYSLAVMGRGGVVLRRGDVPLTVDVTATVPAVSADNDDDVRLEIGPVVAVLAGLGRGVVTVVVVDCEVEAIVVAEDWTGDVVVVTGV